MVCSWTVRMGKQRGNEEKIKLEMFDNRMKTLGTKETEV